MLVSYEWLQDYLKIDLTPKELANKIEKTSVEVDSVSRRDEGLKKIVVGKILSIEKHPDSDHLNITQVDVGEDEPLQIVCGAPNVAVNKKVIVALPGSRIADNVKIKKSKMRGVPSNGMLCALDEIGFPKAIVPDEWKDGIYFMPEDANIGDAVYDYLGMNQSLIDLDVTPNRGDMLSLRGTVYDLGAVFNQKVNFEEDAKPEIGSEKSEDFISATADENLAPQYYLKVVKNVNVHPSPLWLQIRLWNAGIKPINNVVDVTNYVMTKLGQPMHAYDLNKLSSKNIEVRNAQKGEKIITLDDKEHELDEKDVVISDGNPIALAGLMGGKATEVEDETTDVVLEAAVFDPVKTRKMAQKEQLHTDASQRFERGVDRGNVQKAINYAAGMVQELADAEAEKGLAIGSDKKLDPTTIKISVERINHVLGTDLSKSDTIDIFDRLGFKVVDKDSELIVTVPTRTWDLKIEADLIEEVARIYGYDNIKSTLPVSQTTEGSLPPKTQLIRDSRHTFEGLGLTHAMSYSLTTPEKAKMFMLEDSVETKLQWPMTVDHSILRMNLVSGLLDDVAYNQARKVENVQLYEQGRVFYNKEGNVRPVEVEHIAGAISGSLIKSTWDQKSRVVDFFEIKGIVEKYVDTLSLAGNIDFVQCDSMKEMHPGRTALIMLDDHVIGFVGQVHPLIARKFKIKDTYVFELNVDELFAAPKSEQLYTKVSQYPTVKRDIALLVNDDVSNQDIENIINRRCGKYLKSAIIFDEYEGENVPDGKKSMAYSLTFENTKETLKDETIDKAIEKVQSYLKNDLKAEIR